MSFLLRTRSRFAGLFFSLAVITTLTLFATNSAFAATVKTDKTDYLPGDPVIITGLGWQPFETVSMLVHPNPQTIADVVLTAQADVNGRFTTTTTAPPLGLASLTLKLTATGLSSGLTATIYYWEGPSGGAGSLCDTPAAPGCSGATSLTPHNGEKYKLPSGTAVNSVIVNGTFLVLPSTAGACAGSAFPKPVRVLIKSPLLGTAEVCGNRDAGTNVQFTFNPLDPAPRGFGVAGCQAVTVAYQVEIPGKGASQSYFTNANNDIVFDGIQNNIGQPGGGAVTYSAGYVFTDTNGNATSCAQSTTAIHKEPDHSIVTSVVAGSTVHDSAVVSGIGTGGIPTGQAIFTFHSNSTCTQPLPGGIGNAGTVAFSGGIAHPSQSFTVPSAGNYSFSSQYAPDADSPYAGADSPCEPLDVTPQKTGSIGDRVWNDQDGDGVQDAGEPGMVGVTVTLKDSSNSVIATQLTGANGIYTFTGLAADTYTVCTSNPAGFVQTYDLDGLATPNCAVAALATGEDRTDVDFGYRQPLGSIGDRVWEDQNNNGVQDAGEPGIVGVTVTLKDSLNNVIATQTTGANGIYTFPGLVAGTYTVCTSNTPAGFVQTYDLDGLGTPNCATLVLGPGGIRTDVDFGYFLPPLPPHLTISKQPEVGTFASGTQLVFTIVVGNDGGSPATHVHLHDQLPGNGGLLWTGYTTSQGVCTLSVSNLLDCDLGTILPGATATVTVRSQNPTPTPACQLQPNPQALATADGGLQAEASASFSCTPPPLPCPAGSFTYSVDGSGNLTIVFDQFPAPNDNSYGVNSIGWNKRGHRFSDLVNSDHAGFQLTDPSGRVMLSFNIDYLTAKPSAPSGYGSLGPFGGDGGVLVGTLTPSDIAFTTSLDLNLNNVNIPGLFNAAHVQQFGSVNVFVDSPPTDPNHQTYTNSDPLLVGWDFHNTYYVTIAAAKLAALGFNSSWKVEPNLDALHNSPAKPCPPAGNVQSLTVAKKEIKDKEVKITLLNSGTVDEVISALQLTWPASNGKLMQIKLDGDVIYSTPDIPPPSANLTLVQLVADPKKRTIKHGESDLLHFIFEKNADTNLSNYTGTVNTSGFALPILP